MAPADGIVGLCECGRIAAVSCERCRTPVCDLHANALPATPTGISADAAARFKVAVLGAQGPHCEPCRAERGQYALSAALSAPRAPLPEHWLDRAIALSGDDSRSLLEKVEDARLPAALTASDVAQEFLRRIRRAPCERVPVRARRILAAPRYVEGWTVDCRRTEYLSPGPGRARYRLPCLISVGGDLLGPVRLDDHRASSTWSTVPESDIDLSRLVASVANILMLSAFAGKPSQRR